MKQNIKVAKKLIKLAKSLIAEQNIADKEGYYENFTGIIKWKEINGKVINATFKLVNDMNYDIIWERGTWESNTIYGSTWKNGVWKDGQWVDGTWFNGVWEKGVWEYGEDKNRNEHGKDDSPDKWEY